MKLGDALFDEISESQRSKWRNMIESNDSTHSRLHNIESLQTRWLTNYYSMVKETLQMEHLIKGINAVKSNKAAGPYDMIGEQIKNFGPTTLRWVLQVMNSILKFSKLWRKSKVLVILKPISLICHTYKLILNRQSPH